MSDARPEDAKRIAALERTVVQQLAKYRAAKTDKQSYYHLRRANAAQRTLLMLRGEFPAARPTPTSAPGEMTP